MHRRIRRFLPRATAALCLLAACKEPTTGQAAAHSGKGEVPEKGEASVPATGLPDRDPALARKLVREEGALLLDVRTPEEFAEGHVDGAVNVPVDEVESRIDEILQEAGGDRKKPIVVYCRSGRRAARAKEILMSKGFTRVTNLGGLSDWCEDC